MNDVPVIYERSMWKVIDKKRSMIDPSVYVYQVIIGKYNDNPINGGICEFISKDNFDNIMMGKYSFIKTPYAQNKIIIFDENNKVVPLINVKDLIDEQQKRM